MENIAKPPVKPAKRPWITASGVAALAVIVIFFVICWVPQIPILEAAGSFGWWFFLWVLLLGGVLLSGFVGFRIVYGKKRDRVEWRIVKYSIIAFGVAGLITVDIAFMRPPISCSKAVIEVFQNPNGEDVNVSMTVTDPRALGRLVGFFPHLGQGWGSGRTGKWMASAKMTFTGSDGRVVEVATSWDYKYWSEGEGDWPLAPEFRKYISSLDRGSQPPISCSKADIEIMQRPADWSLVSVKKVMTDPKELKELVAFFPHLGEMRNGSLPSPWKGSALILFTGCDGRRVQVATSYDYRFWSEGNGDWPLDPTFSKYIESLLETPQTKPD